MRAGAYRHKITVQQPTESRNSYGEATSTWATYCMRRARIKSTQGQETFTAAQIYGQRTTEFRIRHDSTVEGITLKMRVNYDSRLFDIKDINHIDERGREVVLTCTEDVA